MKNQNIIKSFKQDKKKNIIFKKAFKDNEKVLIIEKDNHIEIIHLRETFISKLIRLWKRFEKFMEPYGKGAAYAIRR